MDDRSAILCYVQSTANPLAVAWVESLQIAGFEVVAVSADKPSERGWSDDRKFHRFDAANSGTDLDALRNAVRDDLGGADPAILFIWWGFGLLRQTHEQLRKAFPQAKVVLCVDTYPNASIWVTELREWLLAWADRRVLDGVVGASEQMVRSLQRRRLIRRALPALATTQPLPLRTHARTTGLALRPTASGVIFTGRSDYLYSRDRRMAKDAVGELLQGYLQLGVPVTISRPTAPEASERLAGLGYSFYERFTNEGMLSGEFADFVSTFQAQLAIYNEPNSTIRRRVATGLSTRWAFGVAATAPIIASAGSKMAEEFFQRIAIGFRSHSPRRDLDALAKRGAEFREAWIHSHREWSAEGQADRLREFIHCLGTT